MDICGFMRPMLEQLATGRHPWPTATKTILGVSVRFRWTKHPGLWQSNLDDEVSGADCRVSRQLLPSPPNCRSDLGDPPARTTAPSGGALRGRHERTALRPAGTHRCRVGWRAPGQYAGSLARRKSQRWVYGRG